MACRQLLPAAAAGSLLLLLLLLGPAGSAEAAHRRQLPTGRVYAGYGGGGAPLPNPAEERCPAILCRRGELCRLHGGVPVCLKPCGPRLCLRHQCCFEDKRGRHHCLNLPRGRRCPSPSPVVLPPPEEPAALPPAAPSPPPEPVLLAPPQPPEPVLLAPPQPPEPVLLAPPQPPEPVLLAPPQPPEPVLLAPPQPPEPVLPSPPPPANSTTAPSPPPPSPPSAGPPPPDVPRGIFLKVYANYVSPGGICCTLPSNYSALGDPIIRRVLPYVNCERDFGAPACQPPGGLYSDQQCIYNCFSPLGQDFAALFTGQVLIPQDGDYTFGLISDDGTRLFIDGVKVIENDGSKGTLFETSSLPITLSRGWHPVRVEFSQGPDHFNVNLRWSGPGIPNQTIPNFYLTPKCCGPLPIPPGV